MTEHDSDGETDSTKGNNTEQTVPRGGAARKLVGAPEGAEVGILKTKPRTRSDTAARSKKQDAAATMQKSSSNSPNL